MASQTSGNVLVAISRQTAIGTVATATGATQMRITDSPGLSLDRADIQSQEKRDDGLKTMGRLGNKTVTGSYNAELTVGGATDIGVEAIMRSTWSAAVATTFASMTTVDIGTNTITAAAGSWITQSIRTGDIVTISGSPQAANNDTRLPVTAVTASVITFLSGTGLATGTAIATGTITRLKKVVNGTTPTNYAHTIEQYDQDIDLSERFEDCRLVGFRLSARPNSPVTITYTFLGLDRTILATGTSPYFTSPTLTTGLALIADDGVVRYNGASVTTFTGFDLDFTIAGSLQPVLGSTESPDVFMDDMTVTGSITAVRQDLAALTAYDAETEFEISMLLQELATAPKPCFSVFLPRVKFKKVSAPAGGGDGAKIETRELMIGPKVAATGYDGTIALFSSSAS